MTNKTQEIRTAQLIEKVMNHRHKNELIDLMYEQVQEDTYKIP